MSDLKKDFKSGRKDSGKTGARGTENIASPASAETSRVLKLFLTALVALSVAAVCIENGLDPLALIALLPICAALMRRDYDRPYIWSETFISGLLVVYVAAVVIGILVVQRRLVIPSFMVYFTFGILIARTLSPLTNRSIPQLIFLSVGLILINCILTNHLIFGLLLPFYLFVLMGTLMAFLLDKAKRASVGAVDSHEPDAGVERGAWRRLALSSAIVLAATILLFAMIPRPFLISPSLAAAISAMGGRGNRPTHIGYDRNMGNMADRRRIAFYVQMEKGFLPRIPYWRGRALEKTDGQGWFSVPAPGGALGHIRATPAETLIYKFIPYRLPSHTIYASGLPISVRGRMEKPLYLNSRGEIVIDSPFLIADSYRITAVNRPVPAKSGIDRINLDRKGVTPRIEGLALEWTSGLKSPEAKAVAIAGKLRREYKYNLQNPQTPENLSPVEYFLFESKLGNCECFSGALCLMLRSIGIPARVIEGFAGAEKTRREGQFVVRFTNYHAWVEASLGDGNWTLLEPSPPAPAQCEMSLLVDLMDLYDAAGFYWNKYVVHFDRTDQARILKTLSDFFQTVVTATLAFKWKKIWILWAVGIAAIMALAWFAAARILNRTVGPSRIYLQTMNALKRQGVLNRVDSWHENNLAQIIGKFPQSKHAAQRFMEIYFKARFGTTKGSLAALNDAREKLLLSVKNAN
jgi:hypothetical protein